MAVYNIGSMLNQDSETGCMGSGVELESCRQSFFLKQQNQILKQNSQAGSSADNNQKIKDLESQNTAFQKTVDQQNKQLTQIIQNSDQLSHKIERLGMINMTLIIVIGVVACAFIVVKLIKRISTRK